MSEYDDLVKELRDHQNGGRRRECEEAADAITQLQARVAELEKDAEKTRVVALNDAIAAAKSEHLTDPVNCGEDEAYDTAIRHVCEAIEALKGSA